MDSVSELEHIDRLVKEAESLKIRLEDERQKLNDVTRNYPKYVVKDKFFSHLFLHSITLFYMKMSCQCSRSIGRNKLHKCKTSTCFKRTSG